MALEFEWDRRKAIENRRKHGVEFEEAVTVFADPLAQTFSDPDHSMQERRELIVGSSALQRMVVVSFSERGDRLRIISARQATTRERREYEQHSEKKR